MLSALSGSWTDFSSNVSIQGDLNIASNKAGVTSGSSVMSYGSVLSSVSDFTDGYVELKYINNNLNAAHPQIYMRTSDANFYACGVYEFLDTKIYAFIASVDIEGSQLAVQSEIVGYTKNDSESMTLGCEILNSDINVYIDNTKVFTYEIGSNANDPSIASGGVGFGIRVFQKLSSHYVDDFKYYSSKP